MPTTKAAGADDTVGYRDQEPVVAALAKSATVASGRMEGFFEVTGIESAPAGTELAMSFSGAFDNHAGSFSFVMDLSGIADAVGEDVLPGFEDMFGEMEIRQIGGIAYMRFPFFASFLGAETEWISFPADETGAVTAGFLATPGNPIEFLAA